MIEPVTFRVLFLLESAGVLLVEVKRTDIVSDDKSRIYHWLLIDQVSGEIARLGFVSMASEKDGEKRVFNEGLLQFDATGGYWNGEAVVNKSGEVLAEHYTRQITRFLAED